MAIGLTAGSTDSLDTARDQRARRAVAVFTGRFVELFGSTRCYDAQEATIRQTGSLFLT